MALWFPVGAWPTIASRGYIALRIPKVTVTSATSWWVASAGRFQKADSCNSTYVTKRTNPHTLHATDSVAGCVEYILTLNQGQHLRALLGAATW